MCLLEFSVGERGSGNSRIVVLCSHLLKILGFYNVIQLHLLLVFLHSHLQPTVAFDFDVIHFFFTMLIIYIYSQLSLFTLYISLYGISTIYSLYFIYKMLNFTLLVSFYFYAWLFVSIYFSLFLLCSMFFLLSYFLNVLELGD